MKAKHLLRYAHSWQQLGMLALLLACVVCGLPAGAQAQGAASSPPGWQEYQAARNNPQLAQQLLQGGQKVAMVCAHCHGAQGQSNDDKTPVLAGQNPAYLIEQTAKYIDGRRRNMFMEGVMKALSPEEIAGMALFYAQQVPANQAAQPAALVEKGRLHYAKVCVACHGTDGRGTEALPRLAGQHPGYVLTSLKHFKAKDGIRQSAEMQAVVAQMTEADMRAVAAYVASLP